MLRTTNWLDGTQKPVREGFYQRENNGVIIYSYWKAPNWLGLGATTIAAAEAFLDTNCIALIQNAKWRGVLHVNPIELFRLKALCAALKLECKGMRKHGESAYSMVRREFSFKGNKQKVLLQLEAHLEELAKNEQQV